VTVPFELDGVLEPIDDEHPLSVDELTSDAVTAHNYLGVESDPEALAIIEEYISNGWLYECDSAEQLQEFVGGPPIFNKFACIVKEKIDGTVKRRIIMDSRRSSVTEASRKSYRAVLPRATDLISDMLSMIAAAQSPDDVEVFICDAKDAFWQLPLHQQERRFYCAVLRRPSGRVTYLAYARTPQGSRGAPLSWTIIFGLICRCALSVLRTSEDPDTQRMQVYVDDPALVVRGSKAFRRAQVTLMVLVWRILGIRLAIDKGQCCSLVNWIGTTLSIHNGGVFATILQSRLDELQQIASTMSQLNIVSVKDLRSFTGKLQSVPSLLYMWRPFVHMFYAVLYAEPAGAPPNCRWVQQFRIPLAWILAFLAGNRGELERRFTVDAHLRRGPRLTITTDASPYGLGAVLELNGDIVAWFSSDITPGDKQVLSIGDQPNSSDQQVLEALALLVALREWSVHWRDRRVQLSVKSDNVAALTMVCKMQPHSERMAIIARELALDIGMSSVSPDDAVHIPGIANVAADILSRLNQPGKVTPIPAYLTADLRWDCQPRPPGWYRALPPPRPR